MRIDKLLANMGYGTRKDVKKLLKGGIVRVNDELVKDGKVHVNPKEDSVTVQGELVEYKPFIYLIMNKPQGVISATEDMEHKTVIDLLREEHFLYEPFPVGRLDKDTEGLLLLTNDGQFSHALMSPKRHVPKTYVAEILGEVNERDIELFKQGVTLEDGYTTKPAELIINKQAQVSEITLTITEGKYHQVKRMFAAVGKKVTFLKRIKVGELVLDPTLERGAYRELTEEEYDLLTRK
ncbi:pseudouridine synthase [Halalkalibacter nanhaiisediminis]|uniref:Pseudouridine synthase n=1 Tax=Halalkalibacter nanhaiisediminis TaxID=688079 RepID=A0A562QJH3_9BACI|nr:pseudouridine synthase [Halalkalibacter nanhaiisediminis]TWI56907.1 16S rRNA pseudouridine516 synthase [Halalkalibacter nanhaiisediminis]